MPGNRGGKREGAGRKPKADEVKLIERLTPMEDDAHKALHKGVKDGNPVFVKLWFEYFYGKPNQTIQNQQLDEHGRPTKNEPHIVVISKK